MVLEEWVLLEVLDDTVVSIAEVRQEVVVAEQAAHHHLLIRLLLQMACSRFDMFWVVLALWCRKRM